MEVRARLHRSQFLSKATISCFATANAQINTFSWARRSHETCVFRLQNPKDLNEIHFYCFVVFVFTSPHEIQYMRIFISVFFLFDFFVCSQFSPIYFFDGYSHRGVHAVKYFTAIINSVHSR